MNDGASETALDEAGLLRSLVESARAAVELRRTTPTEVLPLFEGNAVHAAATPAEAS